MELTTYLLLQVLILVEQGRLLTTNLDRTLGDSAEVGSATVLVWLRGVILVAGAATLGKQKVLQPVTKSPVNCKLPEAPPELARIQNGA